MAQQEAASTLETLGDWAPRRQRGLWSDAFHRVSRNRLAMASLVILIFVIALAVLGNYLDAVQRHEPRVQEFDTYQSPNAGHFLGTDNLGRDQWARVL